MSHAFLRTAAALLALLGAGPIAQPQPYPSRTVRIIIPCPPGGTSDILARTLAQKLTDEWGQQVIAENRPGAAGNIASEYVAKQRGDPHFLLINTVGTHAINPAIYPSLGFDPIKDFTLITNLVNLPSLLIVHPSVPAATAEELIALAKQKPGTLHYSSAGSGSQPHLTAEIFKNMADVDLVHVPYKGAGPQLLALISGEVQLTFATAPAAVPLIKNKQARAIAVTTAERVSALADVPTLNEGALPGYVAVGWNGLVAPAAIGASHEATVIGGEPLSLAAATLLNGYLITAVTVCDVHRPTLCHTTPQVVPPALAIAERNGASGRALIAAIAAGLETTVRVGLGTKYPAFRARGWHSPGVIGPFGGAAAAGKLLGLDAERQRHAFGLAGRQSAGTFAHWGTPTIKFHQSRGAPSRLLAAVLAEQR